MNRRWRDDWCEEEDEEGGVEEEEGRDKSLRGVAPFAACDSTVAITEAKDEPKYCSK